MHTPRPNYISQRHADRHPGLATLVVLVLVMFGAKARASERFDEDARQLTRDPHRLTGTPEYRRAADYIEQRLRQIGPDEVLVQEFDAVQTQVVRCELQFAGDDAGAARRLALQPMRPNGIMPATTGPNGVTGPIYHAGAGELGTYKDRSPQGCIVVLDYNAGDSWLRAFRLGAKAVIFTPNDRAESWRSHYVQANTNLPRFYYEGSPADLPEGAAATIHSSVPWQQVAGRNVFALIRGTDPVFGLEQDELIVIAAHLDSFGEVPRRSPGARGAVNCAALLKLAAYFTAHPPRRHVLLAFLDGQARGHAGAAAFCRAINEASTLETRQEHWDDEHKFLEQLQVLLKQPDPLGGDSRDLYFWLKQIAADQTGKAAERWYALRRKQAEAAPSDADATLDQQIIQADQSKQRWNDLRRGLARKQLSDDVAAELQICLDQVRLDVAARLAELDVQRRALDSSRKLNDLVGSYLYSLHISLLLGDTTSRWGVAIGGRSPQRSSKDKSGLYSKVRGAFSAAWRELDDAGRPVRNFELGSTDGTLSPPDVLWGAPAMIHSGEIVGTLGVFNVVICTAQEAVDRQGTPDDTLAALNLDSFEQQAIQIGPLLEAVASQHSLSQISSIESKPGYIAPTFTSGRAQGPMAMTRTRGGAVSTPLKGAIVQLYYSGPSAGYQSAKIPAFDNFQVVSTNLNGSYASGPHYSSQWRIYPSAFAAAFDSHGQITHATDEPSTAQAATRLNLFRCRGGRVVLPPQVVVVSPKVMNAKTDAPLNPTRSHIRTQDGVTYWYCRDQIESIKLFGLNSMVALVNEAEALTSDDHAQVKAGSYRGRGLLITDSDMPSLASAGRAAGDLWRLDETRMQILRDRGIMNGSIEELHGRAEDLLHAADGTTQLAKKDALYTSAFMAEKAVYTRVRATLDDLVYAVLVLLGLCVPFAFALERLLIGSPNVYRQISGFAAIFAVTFLILFLTHPAFSISKTPAIIFLGFAILVLSMMVIVIIMAKFEVELKVFQGLTSTVHAADVSRLGTILAAITMGISTMRRRPLRTGLTAATIVLLTFTILCFASFDTRTGVIRLFLKPAPSYTGVLFHRVNWEPIPTQILELFQGRWSEKAQTCGRYWLSPSSAQAAATLVSRTDGAAPVALLGILGIEEAELSFRSNLADSLGGKGAKLAEHVYFSAEVAQRLKVMPGDKVLLGGLRLTVGKLLNAVAVSVLYDMDESPILPVDFQNASNKEIQAQQVSRPADDTVTLRGGENWTTLAPDSVAIVSAATARRLGGNLRVISLYVDNADVAEQIAPEMARMLGYPVSATLGSGVHRFLLGALVQANNIKDLLFPLLLGGLVVFGTMLGSVADRQKEIYSFSALGLAPAHIASLFVAEAMVFAVIGGLGGYLLAQGTMTALTYPAGLGWIRVPEMNYSSTNAIATILVVMATVLISAIYPALKASRSANPGIARSWRMPPPEGDKFEIAFPFTVSQYDFTGIASFLKEHFDNYTDTGLGVFMAQDAALVERGEDKLGISARLALAPFDLGVTQSFELYSVASEIPGIDEVKIDIERRSGQPKDWQRLNKVLLNDIRRQFLIWRSLPQETMEVYRQRTLGARHEGTKARRHEGAELEERPQLDT
jgi:hypothetical protein